MQISYPYSIFSIDLVQNVGVGGKRGLKRGQKGRASSSRGLPSREKPATLIHVFSSSMCYFVTSSKYRIKSRYNKSVIIVWLRHG